MNKIVKMLIVLIAMMQLTVYANAEIGYINKKTKTLKVTLVKQDQVEIIKKSGKNVKAKVWHNRTFYTVTIPAANVTVYKTAKKGWMDIAEWMKDKNGKKLVKLAWADPITIIRSEGKKLYIKAKKKNKTYYGYISGFAGTIRSPEYLVWD